jgi:hypothetical protein
MAAPLRNAPQEIQGYKTEAQKQSKLIYQLEKEREKYSIEASEASAKYMQVGAGKGLPRPRRSQGCSEGGWGAGWWGTGGELGTS